MIPNPLESVAEVFVPVKHRLNNPYLLFLGGRDPRVGQSVSHD